MISRKASSVTKENSPENEGTKYESYIVKC